MLSVLLSTAVGVVASTPAPAAPSPTASGPAGHDYATDHFADPWDYSNFSDLLTDPGPALGYSSISMSGGQVAVHFSQTGYISPLWGGYPGSIHAGRDGGRLGNSIDANVYKTVSFQAYSSTTITTALYWFSCPGGGVATSCGGAKFVHLLPGWHTYVLQPGASEIAGWARPWTGTINGLRLADGGGVDLRLDWMRVSQPFSGTNVTWTNPSGGTGSLLWRTVSSAQPGSGSLGATSGTSGTRNVVELPAGVYQIGAANAAGTVSSWTTVTLSAPLPRVIKPYESGDRDYAATVLHDPWDLHDAADVSQVGNSAGVSLAGAQLSATNTTNDPYAMMRIAPGGIPGATYKHLSVTSSYSGAFNLLDTSGGGTMARVQWQRGDGGRGQSADILTYTGVRTTMTDLSDPASLETDVPVAPYASGSPAVMFRWDPNEDRGARRWYLQNVQLRSDYRTTGDFVISWADASNEAGSTATLIADTDRAGCNGIPIATDVPVAAGVVNQTVWHAGDNRAGPYWICLRVTHGAAVTQAYASGPVVIGLNPPVSGENPVGSWDSAAGSVALGGHSFAVSGWTFDPSNPQMPIGLEVYDHRPDGSVPVTRLTTGTQRLDVSVAFPGTRVGTGFAATIGSTRGAHTVCVVTLDIGVGDNRLLGCRTVIVP